MISQSADGALLEVLAVPRASQTRVVGPHDGRLRIQLAAPPVDGEANEQLAKFLASAVGVRRRDVEILRGQSGRRKTVLLRGVDAESVLAALGVR